MNSDDFRTRVALVLAANIGVAATIWVGSYGMDPVVKWAALIGSLVTANVIVAAVLWVANRRSNIGTTERRQLSGGTVWLLTFTRLVGAAVVLVGAILPTRLPRIERNLGREALCGVLGMGLTAVVPAIATRLTRSDAPEK